MNPSLPPSVSRRRFLTGSTTATLTPVLFPYVLGGSAAAKDADNQDTLKIGLVGCGGRGTGAASQALSADYNVKLHAVADVSREKAEAAIKQLATRAGGRDVKKPAPAGVDFADRVDVPAERQFIGLEGYKQLIACCDVVILATPPGFRPMHLTAAVEAGKHIFCEKPMAVDAAGYRVALEAIRKAKEKKICVVAGFCWRRSASRMEAMKRLHDGQIGDIASFFATYYTGPVKPMPEASARPPGISDVEWQVRNWYNFSWLGGDGLVEQAVQSVDKIGWAFRDTDPISCVATGGRQIPAKGGNIFDHIHAAYEFGNNVIAHLGCRQITGCYNENADHIRGTKGALFIGSKGGGAPMIDGEERWRFRGEEKNMYQVEHDELFAAIRAGKVINDGDWMLHSTMLAVMGRMAAYSGKKITWKDAIESKEDLAPEETLKWGDKFEPTPMPRPGQIG
jgi:predicted dehydrogenase